MRQVLRVLVAAAAMVAGSPAMATGLEPACEAPVGLLVLGAALPVTHDRLTRREPLRVLAIGSSSTQGYGASRPEYAYPAVLARVLSADHPDAPISVVNAGIGGQTALHARARLESEVLRTRPHLVLWQAGANDAMNAVDLDQFRDALLGGVAMLRRSGIDVVLLPPQYAPAVNRVATRDRYLETMRDVATTWRVPFFQRYELGRHAATRPDPPKLLTADGLHLNDLGYRCLATQLATAIERAAGDPGGDPVADHATATRPGP